MLSFGRYRGTDTMSSKVKVDLDTELYDEATVRDTAKVFGEVCRATVRKHGEHLALTVTAAEHDADVVAGELLNLALARTLEKRSTGS